MSAALHFRTARVVLDKARRERDRLAETLDRRDLVAAADHLFNLAVTVLAVRDWVKKTAPQHRAAAATLVDREPAMARLFDSATIGKHGGWRDPDHKHHSAVEIVDQRLTTMAASAVALELEPKTVSKATLADGARHFHLPDADAAIAAWEKFLMDRGL